MKNMRNGDNENPLFLIFDHFKRSNGTNIFVLQVENIKLFAKFHFKENAIL